VFFAVPECFSAKMQPTLVALWHAVEQVCESLFTSLQEVGCEMRLQVTA